MALDPSDKADIRAASSSQILLAAARVKQRTHDKAWLTNSNVYAVNVVKKVTQRSYLHRHRQLAEYIAVSAPLHCLDGWSYLARALSCHVRADTPGAVHFGYYAELRAAMALLACNGVGVFNRKHVIFKPSASGFVVVPKIIDQRSATHEFAWEGLQLVAEKTEFADLIGTFVSAGGSSLAEWLETPALRASSKAAASDWLLSWGLDLRRMTKDRDARNTLSYRPTRLNKLVSLDVEETAAAVRDMWTDFEPAGGNAFETLDRYLIRREIEQAFQTATGSSPRQARRLFAERCSQVVDSLGFSADIASVWTSFLIREANPRDPMIVLNSVGRATPGSTRYHMQLLSRAALLLRLATGATEKLLADSGLTQSELEFWWRPMVEDAGLIAPGIDLTSMSILWSDVEIALEDMDDGNGSNDRQDWLSRNAASLMTLTGFERVGLWGLFP